MCVSRKHFVILSNVLFNSGNGIEINQLKCSCKTPYNLSHNCVFRLTVLSDTLIDNYPSLTHPRDTEIYSVAFKLFSNKFRVDEDCNGMGLGTRSK